MTYAQDKTVAVIGAGIVGVCTAAYLQREGFDVVLIDRSEPGTETSFGNAGSLSPSAILPVAMPGILKKVPGWLLDPRGALRVRWWYAPAAIPWLVRFLRYSDPQEVRRIAAAMHTLLEGVFDAYQPLIDRAGANRLVRRNGCLYVYETEAEVAAGRFGAELRRENGTVLQPVGADELRQMEPALSRRFKSGLYAPDNGSTLDPHALTDAIARRLVVDGGRFVKASVTGIRGTSDGIEIETDGERLKVEKVVIAAGAWSNRLAKAFGDGVPLETQRGYHATVAHPNVAPSRTVMWPSRNLMVNPMAMGLRFAGTVEFAGLNAAPDMRRAEALLDHGRELFPELDTTDKSFWMGHRPCLPDSLPVIGQSPNDARVYYAFGHQHVGMCGGAPTGRAVAELIAGKPARFDLAPFRVDRFRRNG